MSEKPVRARLRRVYVDEGTYFVTAATRERRPVLAEGGNIDILRETLRQVHDFHPFTMLAYVFLHEHLHLLLRVGKSTNISQIMHSAKRNFTLNVKAARGLSGSISLWQKGFWDHVIRDEEDFRNHLDYIHYNPVKHGYVKRPEDYPHSSYLEYVRRGWYELGWGHAEPENILGFDTPELWLGN